MREMYFMGIISSLRKIKTVKDKNNLADYNFWSGGDYLKNTNNISVDNGTIELSSYHSNGECSFKLIRTSSDGNCIFRVTPITLTNEDIGKIVNFSCDIYSPNNNASIQIYNNSYKTAQVPVNDNFYTYSISHIITITNGKYSIFLTNNELGAYCYIDNISIIIQ